jgi:MFS transporter, DHA2 family, multidrug resistance protein
MLADMTPAVSARPSRAYLMVVTLTTIVPVLMAVMDSGITNVGFDVLAGSLGVSVDEITAINTSYMLAMLVAMPLAGWFAANLGRKQSFLVSIAVFTAASVLCAMSSSLTELVLARLLQGFGAGVMQTMSSAALVDAYPKDMHVKAFKYWGLGIMVGPILGPALGGWIFANASWQFAFLINVPLGIAAFALGMLFLPVQSVRGERRPFDWTSLGLMSTGFACLLYVLQEGPHQDWFSAPAISAALASGVALVAAFVVRQLLLTKPLVDLRPLRIPSFSVGITLAVITGVSTTGVAFIVPLYFQQVLGFDSALAGLGMLPTAFGSIAAIQFGGSAIAARVPPALLTIIAIGLVGAGTFWLAMLGKDVGFEQIVWPRLVQGIGSGMFYIPLNVLINARLEKRDLDGATGISGVARQLGMSFGYAGLSALLAQTQLTAMSEFSRHVKTGSLTPELRLAPIRDWLISHGWSASDAATATLPTFGWFVQRAALAVSFEQTFLVLTLFFAISMPGVAVLWRLTSIGAKTQ